MIVLAAVVPAALGLFLAWVRLSTSPTLDDGRFHAASWAMSDFKSVLYYPALALMEGFNPYEADSHQSRYPTPAGVYVYPPILFVLARPLAMLPVDDAMLLYLALTILLIVALAYVSLRLAGAEARLVAVVFVAGLILASRPGHWNLLLGQLAVPLALATYSALHFGQQRSLWAAVALALCLLKPNYGGPLAVIMLALGQRAAVALGVGLVMVVNIPLVAMLAAKAGGLTGLVRAMIASQPTLAEMAKEPLQVNYHRVDASALISHFTWFSMGAVGSIVIAVLVLGTVAIALRASRQGPATLSLRPGPTPSAVGLILVGILICGYHLTYDLLLLTWPCIAMVRRLVTERRQALLRHRIAAGLFIILWGNYLASTTVIEGFNLPPLITLLVGSANGFALLGLFGIYLRDLVAECRTAPLGLPEAVTMARAG